MQRLSAESNNETNQVVNIVCRRVALLKTVGETADGKKDSCKI